MKTLSWDKIQQGDEEAFRQLYEQYADLLYGDRKSTRLNSSHRT